jgi:hypothetical protein
MSEDNKPTKISVSESTTRKTSDNLEMMKLAQENKTLAEQVKMLKTAHEQALQGKKDAIAMATRLRDKLAEYENEKMFAARAHKINKITKLMQSKGMIDTTPDAFKKQLAILAEMDDTGLESWKKLVLETPSRITVQANENPQNKKFTKMNNTFYIPTSDQEVAEKISPMSALNSLDNLPWSGLPPSI